MRSFAFVRTGYSKSTLRGFSLGEVLLAAFVLTAGILAITALMASSLRNSYETRDAIIAVELAQEGVELIRNLRDNNLAMGNPAFQGFSNNEKHCRRSYNDLLTAPLDCQSSQGPMGRYVLDYASGAYFHASPSSAPSRFSRYLYIDYSSSSDRAQVRSFVLWGNGSLPPPDGNTSNCTIAQQCVFTEVTLTNWQ